MSLAHRIGVASLAAALFLAATSECAALEFIKDVSKDEAKKLGVVIQTHRNGEAGMLVNLDFEPKGELKNFLRVEVEMYKDGKCLIHAPLQTSNPTPGKIAAYISTDATNFPWTALKIVVMDGTRTRIGYRFPLKNFAPPDVVGPLTFALGSPDTPLKRDADGRAFVVRIGWPGSPGFSALATTAVPATIHPVARFEFPHRESAQPPINLEVVLDQRCWGDQFYGPVRVPAEAASGKAKVTVSLPAWKEAHVAPATFEIPIEEAAPAKNPASPSSASK